MLKRSLLPAALGLTAAMWLAAGCAPPPPPATPTGITPPGAPVGRAAKPDPPEKEMADTTAVSEAVEAELARGSSVFPKGTTLKSVTVRRGVAALDFNAAFNGLANMGDSTEAGAQKRLRLALSKFPEIEKMTVTVNGKPYDSQMSDWTTPFPVRLTAEEKDAAQDAGAKPTDAGGRQ